MTVDARSDRDDIGEALLRNGHARGDVAEIEKPFGQIVANLAAQEGEIGEGSGRKNARGGKKAERVAAIDHGCTGTG
jgi:hypothetical protein